jgi:hypothetical protein
VVILRLVLLVSTAIGSVAAVVLGVSALLAVGWMTVAMIVVAIGALLWGGGRIARLAAGRARHALPP